MEENLITNPKLLRDHYRMKLWCDVYSSHFNRHDEPYSANLSALTAVEYFDKEFGDAR